MADMPREMQRGSQSRTRRVDGGPYAGFLYRQGGWDGMGCETEHPSSRLTPYYQELTPAAAEEEEGCYKKKKHKHAQHEVCYSVLRTFLHIYTYVYILYIACYHPRLLNEG